MAPVRRLRPGVSGGRGAAGRTRIRAIARSPGRTTRGDRTWAGGSVRPCGVTGSNAGPTASDGESAFAVPDYSARSRSGTIRDGHCATGGRDTARVSARGPPAGATRDATTRRQRRRNSHAERAGLRDLNVARASTFAGDFLAGGDGGGKS